MEKIGELEETKREEFRKTYIKSVLYNIFVGDAIGCDFRKDNEGRIFVYKDGKNTGYMITEEQYEYFKK